MLPSQTARSSSSRAHMYRRPRHRKLPAVIVALLILAGGGVVFKWWQGSGQPSPAQADPPPPTAPAAANRPALTNAPSKSTSSLSTPTTIETQAPYKPAPINPPPVEKPIETVNMGASPLPKTEPAASESPKASPPEASNADRGIAANSSPSELTRPGPTSTSPTVMTLAGQRLQAGLSLLAQNKPVEARAMLSSALQSPNMAPADADRIRTELTRLNQRMIFGPEVMAGDPFASSYVIEAGDSLAKLPRKLNLKVDWRFLQRINNIAAPEKLRVGQKIKVVKGPFHAVVSKPDFRMDIYMGDPGSGSDRVYVRSIKVGLGEYGATPEGEFIVKTNSKLVDPAWTNPRTGEYFAPKDPMNPLGKYWIGLIGTSENIRDLETYGIHGTIDPDSIGELRSMGCVRLGAEDVALTYELLIEGVSRVAVHGEDYP